MAQTFTLALQAYAPSTTPYSIGPGTVPHNTATAQFSLSGSTAIPAGGEVNAQVWVSYDSRVTWVGPGANVWITDGTPAGTSMSCDMTGATDYWVKLFVSGATVTLGGTLTLN